MQMRSALLQLTLVLFDLGSIVEYRVPRYRYVTSLSSNETLHRLHDIRGPPTPNYAWI